MTNLDKAKPARAFLDANVLFSAAIGGGVITLWSMKGVALVTSEYAAHEAHHNLQRRNDGPAAVTKLEDLLAQMELHPGPDLSQPLFCAWKLPDPNDVPILMGAIEANCEYLVTGDKACFGEYYGRTLDGVMVLRPSTFIHLLAARARPDAPPDPTSG